MEKTDVSRNQLITELLRIGHGDLSIYNNIGLKAVASESELFAHLMAWNAKKGEVRDSKTAFPVLALRGAPDDELYENAIAHLCQLDPRNLLKAIYYHRTLPALNGTGVGQTLKKNVKRYIQVREQNRGWWDKTVLQHRKSMKALYALFHVQPRPFAQKILFQGVYPPNSIFTAVKQLKNMDVQEAAGTILNKKIPFTIAVGALGGIKDKPDIILALLERMSGAELITNTKMLKRFGVFESPTLKSAYDSAIERTKKDKVSTLKAGKAASAVTDKKASGKLKQIQEDRLAQLGGIEGDWLVLGDKSGSMGTSIEVAKQIASLIAQQVKGSVHLVFFDTSPTYYDVTNKTLDEIQAMTSRIQAIGGTSIGCGLDLIYNKGIIINGIAICSDGGDNTKSEFHQSYPKYAAKFGMEPTVYHFYVPGDQDALTANCNNARILVERFDLGQNVDYVSLPQIILTMRENRYQLVQEILDVPLLTLNEVFG
ncbi:hypothetical protein LCGC14_0671640 [marine sediment metagenome]|uniref:VWFA domain-containing protein n=1 Tax=marine sediment metagenome TaxID=412755 RepID=A0A0F9TYT2_9ZZZZ